MTAASRSPIRVILFDAVGTVLEPVPSASEAYFLAGHAGGSSRTREEVAQRFRHEFSRKFGGERAATNTSEELERSRWRSVVANVFDDVADIDAEVFPRLWEHFGNARNWQLFADAIPTWQALAEAGYVLGLASNFDSRLRDVCRGFPLLADCPHVFASSDLGWAKPAVEFFRSVERKLGRRADEVLLVGDDWRNDYQGAVEAGWQARWLDRDADASPAAVPNSAAPPPPIGSSPPTASFPSQRVSSLTELLDEFLR